MHWGHLRWEWTCAWERASTARREQAARAFQRPRPLRATYPGRRGSIRAPGSGARRGPSARRTARAGRARRRSPRGSTRRRAACLPHGNRVYAPRRVFFVGKSTSCVSATITANVCEGPKKHVPPSQVQSLPLLYEGTFDFELTRTKFSVSLSYLLLSAAAAAAGTVHDPTRAVVTRNSNIETTGTGDSHATILALISSPP